jgi:hypothetical protein
MANIIGSNPVRDVSPMRSKTRPKGATALTAVELRGLLAKLRESEACQRHDLVNPIDVLRSPSGASYILDSSGGISGKTCAPSVPTGPVPFQPSV